MKNTCIWDRTLQSRSLTNQPHLKERNQRRKQSMIFETCLLSMTNLTNWCTGISTQTLIRNTWKRNKIRPMTLMSIRRKRVKLIDFCRKMPVRLLWWDTMESIKPLTIRRKLLWYHLLWVTILCTFLYIEQNQILKFHNSQHLIHRRTLRS